MLVAACDQSLLVFGKIDFEESTKFFTDGAAIGIWLIATNSIALAFELFPTGLALTGILSGTSYIVTVIAFLIQGQQNLVFYIGGLVLGISYPLWAIWLGRLIYSGEMKWGLSFYKIGSIRKKFLIITKGDLMSKNRMEAFSDGVLAIIITIMVLELAIPHEADLAALQPLIPVFLSYVLSFIFLGIYWNNHHHLMQAVQHVNGRVLWANLHLLFWLSLIPFVTGWMGENNFAALPIALYGIVLLFAAIAYFILTRSLLAIHERESVLATALGRDFKGKLSLALYLLAIPLAFVSSWIAGGLYIVVAIIWLIPDRRIEKTIS